MSVPKYENIPIDPNLGRPEYYKDWIAVILDLIKAIKGTNNYYELTPMTILEIIGDGKDALSLSELTQLITRLNSNSESTSEEISNLSLLIEQLSNKVKEVSVDISNVIQDINTNVKPEISKIVSDLLNLTNRVTALENKISDDYLDSVIEANTFKITPIRYIRVRMYGGSSGGNPTDGNYLAFLGAYNPNNEYITPTGGVTSSAAQNPSFPFSNLTDTSYTTIAQFGTGEQWVIVDLGKIYDNIEYIELVANGSEYINLKGIDISINKTDWDTISKECKFTNTDSGKNLFPSPKGRRIYFNDRRAYVDDTLDVLTNQLVNITDMITNINKKLEQAENDIADHTGKISNLTSRVDKAEKNISTNTGNITTLQQSWGTAAFSTQNMCRNSLQLLVRKSTNLGDDWTGSTHGNCVIDKTHTLPLFNRGGNHPARSFRLSTGSDSVPSTSWNYWIEQQLFSDSYTVNFAGMKLSCSVLVRPQAISSEYTQVCFGFQCYDSGGSKISDDNGWTYIDADQLRSHDGKYRYYPSKQPLTIPINATRVDFRMFITGPGTVNIACPCATLTDKACGWNADRKTNQYTSDGERLYFVSGSNPSGNFEISNGDVWIQI